MVIGKIKLVEKMKTHHDLDVWKKSIILVTEIYKITESYP